MAWNTKKRSSSKRIHILLLRYLLLLCFLLMLATLGLQLINLLLPPEAAVQQPSLLGKPSAPFHFNKENVFPFLLAPLLFLIVVYLYLMCYFTRNSISAMDHIPYFRKHRHTKLGRKFYATFSLITAGLSVLLAALCHFVKGVGEAWFGVVVVIGCSLLMSKSAKKIRHTRRQYFAHRRKALDAKDGIK